MAAKVCIHMEGKKTTISSPGVSSFREFFCSVYVGGHSFFYVYFH